MLSAGQNMAEIQLQRRSRDTELARLASLESLARVRVEFLASDRPSLSRGGNWLFFRDRILCHETSLLALLALSLSRSTLRLWLSTNMPRDKDDSMFTLHISDRQESSR